MVGTGFSGGIDSFSVVCDHVTQSANSSYQLTHFLFNNVGSHGAGGDGRRLFHQRYEKLKGFPNEIGLPFIPVDSNLADLLPLDFQMTHTTRNMSVVLLLQKLLGKYLYASTFKYKDCYVAKTYDMAYADPAAVHLLSTETLEAISTGCQYSRVDKSRVVSSFEPSHRFLNICVNADAEGKNCSVCWKCCRTLLTFELLGVLEKYGDVFDLDAYSAQKPDYVYRSLSNPDALFNEILGLADDVGIDLKESLSLKHRSCLTIKKALPLTLKHALRRLRNR